MQKKAAQTVKSGRLYLAEMEGFEPPDGLTRQLISSLLVSVSTSGRFVPVSGRFVCADSRLK